MVLFTYLEMTIYVCMYTHICNIAIKEEFEREKEVVHRRGWKVERERSK